jgi:Zn-dependent protease with chaperone function
MEILKGIGEELVTGPWSRVWPFFVLPLLAVAALSRALSRIEASGLDPQRQARVATIAACVPGLITLSLVAALGFRFRGTQPESLNCYAKLYGPLAVTGIALLRAGGLFAVRRIRVARLLRFAAPPSPRLARIAHEIGVSVQELPADSSLCFVSGLRRPRVVVSTGALASLSDEDLRAALLHERAHLRHRDALRAAIVSGMAEFAVISSAKALRIYRASRESLADDEAARYVGRTEVAGVLVRFARNAARVPVPSSLAEPDGLEGRVRRLIFPERGSRTADARVTAVVAAAAGLALYPAVLLFVERFVFHCGG